MQDQKYCSLTKSCRSATTRFSENVSNASPEFKAEGCTILIVSHDTGQIREFCDEAIWLNSGRLVLHDSPELVVDKYIAAADAAIDQRASVGPENGANRSVQTSS